jgi:hypothetical protein
MPDPDPAANADPTLNVTPPATADPAPAAKPAEPRPKSTLAAIATVCVAAGVGVIALLTYLGRDDSTAVVKVTESGPQLETLSDFGCAPADEPDPPSMISYYIPQLRGSDNDARFNNDVQGMALALLDRHGLPDDVLHILQDEGFKEQALRTPGCTIPTEGYTHGYIYLKFNVTHLSTSLVSMVFRVASYAGPGHEYGEDVGLVYDIAAGRVIGINDIFQPNSGWETVVATALCDEGFTGFTGDCVPELAAAVSEDGHLVVNQRGVTFVFAPCNIAACHAPAVERLFTWEDLRPYVKSDLGLADS